MYIVNRAHCNLMWTGILRNHRADTASNIDKIVADKLRGMDLELHYKV